MKEATDKQLLSICENLGKTIPGCQHLIDEYKDFWSPGFAMDDSVRKEIRRDIKESIAKWIKATPEDEILRMLISLNPKTKAWLAYPRNVLPTAYRYFFRQGEPFARMPNDIVAPNIYLATSDREGNFIRLRKPLVRRYKSTTVQIIGNVVTAYDALLTASLLLFKNEKKLSMSEESIAFNTTLRELSGTVEWNNPYAQNSLRAVWNSLLRLAGVVLEITKPGKRIICHILNEAQHLYSLEESDGSLNGEAVLRIFLGRSFLELEEEHFTKVDIDIMQRLKNKARALCMYLFLARQHGFYSGPKYRIGFEKLHDYAGLRPEGKSTAQIRFEVNTTLDHLKEQEVIRRHQIGKNGVVDIWSDRSRATKR